MHTYLILRRCGWSSPAEFEKAVGRSSRTSFQEMPDRVRWIRSYVIQEKAGEFGMMCIFESADPLALIEHARRATLPCNEILPVIETVVINDDPVRVT